MSKAVDLANAGAVAAYSPTFRNRIINGSALIGQRGTVTSTAVAAVYGTDRMLMGSVAGTGIGINLFKSTFGGASSGLGHIISGNMTNGLPYFAQRIEAQNVSDLNGQYVTISGLLYQNTGSTQNFVVRLTKANAVDNFSAVTIISQGTSFNVPDNTVTPFQATFLLGSSDATNGLLAEVFSTATLTCTGKLFGLADFQLEKGAVKTPFEMRPIGTELALCQRYTVGYSGGAGYRLGSGFAYSTTAGYIFFNLPVTMRSAPSIEGTASLVAFNDGTAQYTTTVAPTINSAQENFVSLSATGTSGMTQFRAAQVYFANASSKLILSSEL